MSLIENIGYVSKEKPEETQLVIGEVNCLIMRCHPDYSGIKN